VGPRRRDRVWAGIAVRSSTRPADAELQSIAERINARCKFRGLWYFQVKRDAERRLKLLEISSRVAGSMSVYRMQGVNLPLLTIYDAVDRDVIIAPNTFPVILERALSSKYRLGIEYDSVYVDLDDTLLCNGEVNSTLVAFLFQAKAKGKRIVLLTKHELNPAKTLAEYHVGHLLFDELVHLDKTADKLPHLLKPEHAIFIDNAFAERLPALRAGIPVFDVDAVAGLLDWSA
jgi:hypothetical protein